MEILVDLSKLSKHITKNVTLAVTCLDQCKDKITVAKKERDLIEFRENEFLRHLLSQSEFDSYLLSYGPTREDCKTDLSR